MSEHLALFFWTETPVHVGTGGESRGDIDQPIQRNQVTYHPIAHASGLKGSLREHCTQAWKKLYPNEAQHIANAVFGPENAADPSNPNLPQPGDFGGAVSVSQAQLLVYPVRSLDGVFAWITCPLALAQLRRDFSRIGQRAPSWPGAVPRGCCCTAPQSAVALYKDGTPDGVVLEEFPLQTWSPESGDAVEELAEWIRDRAMPAPPGPADTGKATGDHTGDEAKDKVETGTGQNTGSDNGDDPYEYYRELMLGSAGSRLVVLSDEDYTDFVTYSVPVNERIRIRSGTGTVAEGALFSEESLPGDCLLYNVLHVNEPRGSADHIPAALQPPDGKAGAGNVRRVLLEALERDGVLQIGGNSTVGYGFTRVRPYCAAAENGDARHE